jgi:YjbE family integral membrane protein
LVAFDAAFWVALLQIIWINILLSGDNAVVIALACRSLPPRQQRWGIILGTLPAIVLRIIFAIVITYLMEIPWLKVIGGLLLFWIAVKMLQSEEGGHEDGDGGAASLWAAVRTIVVADAVMSLDNVIAIAAAARGDLVLLVIGLCISMPLVIFGSAVLLKVLTRFPILVWAGAALLGWIAGEVMASDPGVAPWIDAHAHYLHQAAPAAGAALVVLLGLLLARLAARRKPVDITT